MGSGVTCNRPGAAELPERGTSTDPPTSVFTTRSSVESAAVVGAYVTVTATFCPLARTVPMAGSPETVNGADGEVIEVIAHGVVPSLVKVTGWVVTWPVATPPKLIAAGLAVSSAPTARP